MSRQLGKYELIRHLATGGMAEIHLARAKGIEGFEKLIVVKKLLPQAEQNPSLVSMFLDEARVAATLHHPNVVQVYDIGMADEHEYFFTMEFVYGQDLSRLLRRAAVARRPPSLDQALTIIIGLCTGLHYAHEKEGPDGKPLHLVHRDVSPQNVLISYDGAVKIMDFGIAKAASNHEITRDGTLKGKIAYMSPEQGMSKPLDRRSDLFSLAIMLWELTTFRRLYKAESDFEALRKIIQDDAVPPSRYRAGYPPELERIVMKGLRRDPAARYQTAEEMQLDLEAFARDHKLVISSVSTSRYIRELFQDRIDAWTQARSDGKSFTDFLVDTPLLNEGTAVTADTWVAPTTEPTTLDEAEEPEIVVADQARPAKRRGRWIVVAAAALCALGFAAWRVLSASSGDDATAAAHVEPTAASPGPKPAPAPPAPSPAVVQTAPDTAPPAPPAEPAAGRELAKPTKPVAKPIARPAVKLAPKPAPRPPKKPANEDLDSPFPN